MTVRSFSYINSADFRFRTGFLSYLSVQFMNTCFFLFFLDFTMNSNPQMVARTPDKPYLNPAMFEMFDKRKETEIKLTAEVACAG